MPTTRPRSDRRAALFAVALLCGCASPKPAELFQLSETAPGRRAMETRIFETHDELELLSASAAVLQDLGFQIEESVREVGLLRAVKERSAREYPQYFHRFFIFVLSFGHAVIPIDLHQRIAATLVTRPLAAAARHEVRVSFYRVVWKGEGQSDEHRIPPGIQEMEMIEDAKIYQQFFAKLSKAVFLEAHKF